MLLARHGISHCEYRYLDSRQPHRVHAVAQWLDEVQSYRKASYLTAPLHDRGRVMVAFLCPDIARAVAADAREGLMARGMPVSGSVRSDARGLCEMSYVAATGVRLPLAVVLNSWCDVATRSEAYSVFYTARVIERIRE
jgi:hypothetical protein